MMTEKISSLYGGEVDVIFKENKETNYRAYFVVDKPVSAKKIRPKGPTTYLGIKDKSDALVAWATQTAGLHLYDILQSGQLITMNDVIEAIGKHRTIKEDAALLGTAMHAWCEYFIKHKLGVEGYENKPELPEDPQILLGVNTFLNWYNAEPTEFVGSERIVYSRKYNYVGTMDFDCIRSGKFLCGDFKGSNGLYNTVRAQTAAYVEARQEELAFLGTPKKYDGRVAIRLSKETESEYITRMSRKNMIKGKENAPIEPYNPFEVREFMGPEEQDDDFINGFLAAKTLFEWDARTDFFKLDMKAKKGSDEDEE